MDTLTSDLLICVCAHLPAASACQLRSSYRAALEALDPAWLAHQRGAPTGVATFEQLALHEALTALETSRITFEGASRDIQSSSMPAVSEYARLLRRHPRASAHVDAHTGVHAPSSFAPAFTCERARSVVSELVAQGVAASRLTSTGWGKAIAVAAGWPQAASLHAQRCGSCFPSHSWYGPPTWCARTAVSCVRTRHRLGVPLPRWPRAARPPLLLRARAAAKPPPAEQAVAPPNVAQP